MNQIDEVPDAFVSPTIWSVHVPHLPHRHRRISQFLVSHTAHRNALKNNRHLVRIRIKIFQMPSNWLAKTHLFNLLLAWWMCYLIWFISKLRMHQTLLRFQLRLNVLRWNLLLLHLNLWISNWIKTQIKSVRIENLLNWIEILIVIAIALIADDLNLWKATSITRTHCLQLHRLLTTFHCMFAWVWCVMRSFNCNWHVCHSSEIVKDLSTIKLYWHKMLNPLKCVMHKKVCFSVPLRWWIGFLWIISC